MDACPMIARCHQHQWPEQYGRPAAAYLTPEESHVILQLSSDSVRPEPFDPLAHEQSR
jgi:hypothetical protein